jgi:TnpA family transposase
MFRSTKEDKYELIDELFSSEIDWEPIETHYSDMIRVAMSIKDRKNHSFYHSQQTRDL